MLEKIKKSIAFINRHIKILPKVGIISGSGLGNIAENIDQIASLDYQDIPHFPVSTVEGHNGKLIFGRINSVNIAILQGRIHFYEGYGMEEIIYPVRVLKFLGIDFLIATNASGGLNPDFHPGDLMIHTDHINLMPNPLIGKYFKEFGERFPDMTNAYDTQLKDKLFSLSEKLGISVQSGCYVSVTGPTLETPSEYNYLRLIGGDAVGMSTVPEIIVARQMGIRCAAISVITNMGIDKKTETTTHQEVLQIAELAAPKLSLLLRHLIGEL